jgi:glycosyltransferase involved in cell wall biosynthesis
MLSVLIPTYNYNVYPLVREVHKQLLVTNVAFEILVFDDASTQQFETTVMFHELAQLTYKKLKKNIGRTAIRQELAQEAQYEQLLFMDADTFPKNPDFIKKLLANIETKPTIIYGGVVFQDYKPKKEKLLRWVYAIERESLSLVERQKTPYLSILSTSFLIDKQLFLKINTQLQYKRYGLDILFSYLLKKEKVAVLHIANPVYHFGLETSEIFINKSKEAIDTAIFLTKNKLIPIDYKKMDIWHQKWAKFGLSFWAKITYNAFHKLMEWQLKSAKPSLHLFDWYRYAYYCKKR